MACKYLKIDIRVPILCIMVLESIHESIEPTRASRLEHGKAAAVAADPQRKSQGHRLPPVRMSGIQQVLGRSGVITFA